MSYDEPPPEYGGQPPSYPQYGYPQYGSPYGGLPVEHPRGTTILVLGIVSVAGVFLCLVGGIFTGIPAWMMGNSARKEIAAAPGQYSNAGTLKAGWILGIIGTAVSAVVIVVMAVGITIAITTA